MSRPHDRSAGSPSRDRAPATDEEAYLLTIVDNLQRQDLSPREESAALEALVRERGWSTRQVAAAISRSQAFVSKRLRVFDDPALGPAVLSNQLSVSAAEELLSIPAPQRPELLRKIVRVASGTWRACARRWSPRASARSRWLRRDRPPWAAISTSPRGSAGPEPGRATRLRAPAAPQVVRRARLRRLSRTAASAPSTAEGRN